MELRFMTNGALVAVFDPEDSELAISFLESMEIADDETEQQIAELLEHLHLQANQQPVWRN